MIADALLTIEYGASGVEAHGKRHSRIYRHEHKERRRCQDYISKPLEVHSQGRYVGIGNIYQWLRRNLRYTVPRGHHAHKVGRDKQRLVEGIKLAHNLRRAPDAELRGHHYQGMHPEGVAQGGIVVVAHDRQPEQGVGLRLVIHVEASHNP